MRQKSHMTILGQIYKSISFVNKNIILSDPIQAQTNYTHSAYFRSNSSKIAEKGRSEAKISSFWDKRTEIPKFWCFKGSRGSLRQALIRPNMAFWRPNK